LEFRRVLFRSKVLELSESRPQRGSRHALVELETLLGDRRIDRRFLELALGHDAAFGEAPQPRELVASSDLREPRIREELGEADEVERGTRRVRVAVLGGAAS